jgi:hypothetical protein
MRITAVAVKIYALKCRELLDSDDNFYASLEIWIRQKVVQSYVATEGTKLVDMSAVTKIKAANLAI